MLKFEFIAKNLNKREICFEFEDVQCKEESCVKVMK